MWASVAAGTAAILALGYLLFDVSPNPAATGTQPTGQTRSSPASMPEETEAAVDRMDETEYVVEVGVIQAAAVEALDNSNEKLRRYDSLTAVDVGVMRENLAELGRLERRAENLDPPDSRADHHGLFLSAVGVMRSAAETAHGLASDPLAATWPRFREHEMLVEEADDLLVRSNEMLNRDYETPREDQRKDSG